MLKPSVSDLFIDCNTSMLDAMKVMDQKKKKLLVVTQHGKYENIISIGDIQRAIIKNIPLNTTISEIKIDQKTVCKATDSMDLIKEKMSSIRAEFMPIINDKNELVDLVVWNDLFPSASENNHPPIACPVVIMAGGRGTRLKPLSNVIPKPLIPIGEKTIIEEIIARFRKAGCKDFYLSVNYKKEMIEYYLNSVGEDEGITYFVEDKPLGTAGSLSLLKGKINTTFVVSNCDILINQDFHDVYDYHQSNNNEITLVAALKHLNVPYGVLESGENGLLEAMEEKPDLTFKINAGVYILEPHLLSEIPEGSFFHITDLIEAVKARKGRVGVFPVSEKSWLDIGEWPEYIKTVREISSDNNFVGI